MCLISFRILLKISILKSSRKENSSWTGKKWQVRVDDYSSHQMAKKIDVPVLLVHDTEDGDVPVYCAYHIRQYLKQGSLLISHGLGHTKI